MTDPGDGTPHEYLDATWGCWQAFGEVRSREIRSRPYGKLAQRTVDAYAVQHPGEPGRRQSQSVAVHLMSLCAQIERGMPGRLMPARIQYWLRPPKREFAWIDPPDPNGDLTILDVLAATDAEEHVRLVERWSGGIWQAWSAHHDSVRRWVDDLSR